MLSLSGVLASCAQIKPPSGGPKDQTPPEVVASAPLNFSTRFSASRIIIDFNEYVQLRNLSEQLVINPAMEERPDFRLRGKSLVIELNSPLQPATTYVINFGDAIVDLTEGNKASGLQYVFSTGDALDSLQFSGQLIDAFAQQPVSEALVMLYSNPADTMPYRGKPDYFSKSDAQGRFEINYIRENTYQAFALVDENGNYRYDPPTETIGFLDSLVAPGPADSTNVPARFRMFNEKDTVQYINSREGTDYGQYLVVLHRPADSVSIKPIDENVELIVEHGVVGDTIMAWMPNRSTFTELEAVDLIVAADSAFVDTVSWLFSRPKDDAGPELLIRDNLLFNFNPFSPIRLNFNHPLKRIDTSSIALFRDSVPVAFDLRATPSQRRVEIHHSWEPGAAYRIFAPDSTFFDIFGLTNDTLDKRVEMRPLRYFGNLRFNLQFDPDLPLILEMLDDRGNIVKRMMPESSGVLEFIHMKPGTYSMRVIYDLNRNGEWDTGSFGLQLQPEAVAVYDRKIEIRSNWDMELEWVLSLD